MAIVKNALGAMTAGGTSVNSDGFSGSSGYFGTHNMVPASAASEALRNAKYSVSGLTAAAQQAAAAAPAAIGSAAQYVAAPSGIGFAGAQPSAQNPFSYDLTNLYSKIASNAAANSAQSQAWAREQMAWQEAQNAKAMQFNKEEARLNREWQEMMSNSAHRREIEDLKAAGLNPVLSAMGGNGAAVTSGSSASGVSSSGSRGDVDTSLNSALANIFGSMLSAQMSLEAANINARTQEAVADKYTAMQYITENLVQAGLSSRQERELSWKTTHPQSDAALGATIVDYLIHAFTGR